MVELNDYELTQVSAGFHINLGQAIGAITVGWFAGGPVGLLFAIGGLTMAEGVNNLNDLARK